jgi:glycosyltransferase involved in cell wall biosynthesis
MNIYQHGGIELNVYYTWGQSKSKSFDKKFNRDIQWDIPLLSGYPYEFLNNTSKKPGDDHFFGIVCPTLIKRIEDWNPTHILVFGWNYQAHLNVLRHFKGRCKIWFRGDSTLLDESLGLRKIFRRLFLTWVYRHIDKALYVGTNNRNYYLKHGLKNHQLIYAPHAIDNSRFSNERNLKSEVETYRNELGYTDKDFVILFCGKFEPKKNPLILAKALKNINNPNIKGLFIGSGQLELELKELAKNIDNIRFLPFQNQKSMPVIYRLGDVLCLPSSGPGETWGLVVNEAMACGKPVIISNKVGCAIDLVNNSSGIIFKADDLKSLQAAIIKTFIKKKEAFYDPDKIKTHIANWSFNKITESIITQIND